MSLRKTLTQAREIKKSAFIPFVMAGDPDLEMSEKTIIRLAEEGAGLIELGIPFSDPVADGVTVQKAAERALANGTTLQHVLDLVSRLRQKDITVPICLFTYLNPVFRFGYKNFVSAAKKAGANGALIVDLPPEEADEYLAAAKEADFETVFLASPTTTPERLKRIDQISTGFVYYIIREGVTGVQSNLPETLHDRLKQLRDELKSPFAVGFGISKPEQVKTLAGHADGIVVGSALVKVIEDHPKNADTAAGDAARALIAAL